MRGRTVRAALLLMVAVVVAGCTSGGGADPGTFITNGNLTVIPSAQREPAPAITGTTLQGTPLDLASLRGNLVVVNIWGSWCPPCISEAPVLAKGAEQFRADGVKFVGVAIRDNADSALAFNQKAGITYPSFLDDPSQGSIQLAFRTPLPPPAGPPTTYVLDKQGRIAARALGELDSAELTTLITSVQQDPGS